MNDFLEQLANLDVAPPPREFDRQLHARLNRSLVLQHLLDLAVGAVPWALVQFARAVLGMVGFTLTGKFDDERRREKSL
jgi:hypothetical protein